MKALGLFCLLAGGCVANVLPATKEIKLSRATNDFAFELFNASRNEKNVFISPFSIATALGMVYLGADGTTAEAMRRVLKYDQHQVTQQDVHEAYHSVLTQLQQNTNDYHFSSHNGALIQQDFHVLETYESTLRQHYSAEINTVDFENQGEEIKRRINADVENATRGKIRDFLDEPPSIDTKLFLLNAVYFLGSWKQPFNMLSTHEGTFYNNGVERKTVHMMSRDTDYRFSRISDLRATVLILPYRGTNTASMIILLPNEPTGVEELQRVITRESLDRAVENTGYQRVEISVPKFSLSYGVDLKEKLSALGMGELFSDGADLSGIAAGLKVSKVLHKAAIDVDEKGTEAAAATGVEIVPYSIPESIIVNHPFLFFIRDDTNGIILFAGRVDTL